MPTQLTFNIRLDDAATLSNFYPGNNQNLLRALQEMLEARGENFIYCWGEEGLGRSHLLQACCHAQAESGGAVAYLPLARFREFSPDILLGFEALPLVCLDDVDQIIGKQEWELALFHFYNQAFDNKTRLVFSANKPPSQLACRLPDLASRLAATVAFQILPLSDEEKLEALQMRAHLRGFHLPNQVGKFLLQHHPRDLRSLFSLLEKLDQASLTEQRKLTIPFLKSVLGVP